MWYRTQKSSNEGELQEILLFVCRFVIVFNYISTYEPVPVAARSKTWVCDRLPAEIVGSNPTGDMDVCLF